MSKKMIVAILMTSVITSAAFAQGGGGGGGGAGGAAGAAGSTGGMSGSAGTGSTSTGIGTSPGASSQNTVGQANQNPISPANPSTTQPNGPNSLPLPQGTAPEQNPQNFDPRLSPGYQK